MGAMVGSGGMVAMNQNTCMVSIAKYFMQFIQKESCGKCTFCRIGTKRMLEILEKITEGNGELSDLDKLKELAASVSLASLCQLGKTAPNPVLTTLKYFENEYLEHILDKKCRAGECKALIKFVIDESKCTGCTLCARKCPTKAISGTAKHPHVIDQDKCIRCGICEEVCRFQAVRKIS
jgi:ferredoxin